MDRMTDYLEVVNIGILDKKRLLVEFNDGIKKEVDLAFLIKNPPPVFTKLQDEKEFKKIKINPVGGVSWNCGADLSAEYLRKI